MREYKRYWLALVAVLVVCFSILGYYGVEVYRNSPPVVNFTDENGKVVIDKESIYKGQEAWQSRRYAGWLCLGARGISSA